MKVYGDNKPTTFTVEKQPKHPGYVFIRFYENAQPYESDTYTGWEYDEYHLELPDRSDMDTYIANHYHELLQEAKGGPSATEQLRADLDYIMLLGGF